MKSSLFLSTLLALPLACGGEVVPADSDGDACETSSTCSTGSSCVKGACVESDASSGGSGDGDVSDEGMGAIGGEGAAHGSGGEGTGGVPDPDTSTGGVRPDGGGGWGGDSSCEFIVAATGEPPTIDDFNHGGGPQIPAVDGRAGTWSHDHWVMPAGPAPEFVPDPEGQAGDKYLRASCQTGWCNATWDRESYPWQWASVSVTLQPDAPSLASCYDASRFSGVKFKVRSPSGDRFRLVITSPESNPDTGETYQSGEMIASSQWEEFEVPFSQVTQPAWSTVTSPLGVQELLRIEFVLRTVENQEQDSVIVGERMLPYDLQIDDLSFY